MSRPVLAGSASSGSRGQIPTAILCRNGDRNGPDNDTPAQPSPAAAELDPVANHEAYAEVMRTCMG